VNKIKQFFKTTFLGGVIVTLPVVLTVFLLKWIFNLVTNLIHPLTEIIIKNAKVQNIVAYLIAIVLILGVCFFIGLAVKTRLGTFVVVQIDKYILKIAPGYEFFKGAIKQLFGQERRPFSQVALVQPFQNDTLMTGFITDEHADGKFSVFIPSGLNPTSGMICHLKGEHVHMIDVSVETAMQTVISCGAGSKELLEDFRLKKMKR